MTVQNNSPDLRQYYSASLIIISEQIDRALPEMNIAIMTFKTRLGQPYVPTIPTS